MSSREVELFFPISDGQGETFSRRRSTDVVHQRLREAILHGGLPAGARVSQVQLAEQYGVSRTPLREALRLLQREGLVMSEANRRVRVAEASVTDLEQLYAMRITLESLAIRLTVPLLSEKDLQEAEQDLERMQELAETEDYESWEVPHRTFHLRLVSHVGDRMIKTISQLSDHAERYRRMHASESPRAWSKGIAEHQDILSACKEHNCDLAAERLARHYSTVVLSLIAMLAPEHEPGPIRTALRMVVGAKIE